MRDLGTKWTGAAEARIVGNLAGVVEWANDAFARLSGIALDETLNKPVGRLLERAGIELEIVEFVAQYFFEGQVCRVAFPFERPDGRRIDVLLEVEALRDAVGEIDRFVAIAREEPSDEATSARTQHGRSPVRTASPTCAIDLNTAILGRIEATGRARSSVPAPMHVVELDLERELGPVAVLCSTASTDAGAAAIERDAHEAVGALVAALYDAARVAIGEAGNAGGVITLSTARLPRNRRFVSKVHAIAACPPERSEASDLVVEIHDTGRALPPATVAAIACGDVDAALLADASLRARALSGACARARTLGARIHLDSTPGCGNQLLVLFPPARA